MKKLSLLMAPLAAAVLLLALPAHAVEARKPQSVALIAALGDQFSLVRQKPEVGSRIVDTNHRATIKVPGQQLNYAALRGLDKALELEEPDSQRHLLAWNPPPELVARLDDADPGKREQLLLDALIEHLRGAPGRAQWDRIEAIVPSFVYMGKKGMARKLSGIGIYIQPLARSTIDEEGEDNRVASDLNGNNVTVNPRTGEAGRSSTFVAPYIYFERVTLDARTLKVLARQVRYDNTKYADPMGSGTDVWKDMPPDLLASKLVHLVERSAYKAVRGDVEVTNPVAVPKPALPRP